MIGDAQDQVQFLTVQEAVEYTGGIFYRPELEMGMGCQKFPVELGKDGIPAHGDHSDPQDLIA